MARGLWPRHPRPDPLRAGTARGPDRDRSAVAAPRTAGWRGDYGHATPAPTRCAPGRRAVRSTYCGHRRFRVTQRPHRMRDQMRTSDFGFRGFGFPSDFGLRILDLALHPSI
jgi:hypothetical protein